MIDQVYIPQKPMALNRQKRSKYKNKKVSAQGRKFDSIIERDRWFFLCDAKRQGLIRNLRCQVTFDLPVGGELICRYIADFVYEKPIITHRGGFSDAIIETIVEDVKSAPTAKIDTFVIKTKLMRAIHGVEVRVVKSPTCAV